MGNKIANYLKYSKMMTLFKCFNNIKNIIKNTKKQKSIEQNMRKIKNIQMPYKKLDNKYIWLNINNMFKAQKKIPINIKQLLQNIMKIQSLEIHFRVCKKIVISSKQSFRQPIM